jgi:hypothetical protein
VITRKEGSQEAQHFHWFFGFLTLNCWDSEGVVVVGM